MALQKENPPDLNMINVYTFAKHMTRKWQENIFEGEENQIIVAKWKATINSHNSQSQTSLF